MRKIKNCISSQILDLPKIKDKTEPPIRNDLINDRPHLSKNSIKDVLLDWD